MIRNFFRYLLLQLAFAGVLGISPLQAAERITVRGGEHDTYDRLVFDWTGKGTPTLSAAGDNSFTLTFDQAGDTALPNLAKLKRIAKVTQSSADPMTITLQLKPGNTVKLSRAGTKVVADIKAGDSKEIAKATAPPEAAKPPADAAKSAAVVKTLADEVAKPPATPTVDANGQVQANGAPIKLDSWSENQELSNKPLSIDDAATKTAADKTKTPDKVKDAKAAPTVPVKPPAERLGPGGRPLTIAELADQEKQDAAKPKTADTSLDDNAASDTAGQLAPVPAEPPPLPIATTIKLEVPHDARFAAFMRGNNFWLAFDQKLDTMPTEKDNSTPTSFGPISRYQVNDGQAVIYRIGLAPGQFAALSKQDDKSLNFAVYSQAPIILPPSLPITLEKAKDGKPIVHIKIKDVAPPLKIKDPDVGDELIILPAPPTAGGTTLAVYYPQFDILPTLNGTVIKALTNGIDVQATPKGADVTRAPKDLIISELDNKKNAEQGSERIFDLQHWARGTDADFCKISFDYQLRLADTRGADRLGKIMALAQFLFASNHGREAQGWLDIAATEFPAVTDVPQYVLLRGAIHVLKREFLSGDRDLSLDGYATEPEVALWRGYIAAERGDYTRARYFYHLAGPLLYDYPDPYGKMFTFSAAETALETGDGITAAALIARLQDRKGLTKTDRGQLNYLLAGNKALNGDEDEAAQRYWQRAIKSGNVFYAAKARYAMVVNGLAKKTMTPVEAIKELEILGTEWRDDPLELKGLMLKADLDIQNNKPRDAFEAWQTVIHYYEQSPEAEIARQQISQNFVSLFAPDNQDKLPPIEALGLYRDFISYAPPNEQSIQITQNLVKRLVDLELYKDAADILHDLVFNRLTGDAQQDTALQMAKLLLLDNQPQAMRDTLAVLDITKLNTDNLAAYKLLQARADFQDKKYDNALQEIGDLDNDNARRLRADIYWKSQNWGELAKLLPLLIGDVNSQTKLTPEQARLILQQAIATSMLGNKENLDALRTAYGAQMDASELAASFRLITRPPKGSELQSLSAIQSRLGEVDMFKNFLNDGQKKPAAPAAAGDKDADKDKAATTAPPAAKTP